MGFPPELTEKQLIDKLVTQWHLSVSERRALPNGHAKASLIKAAIVRNLITHGWFPRDWRPEHDFDGGLIERTTAGCNIHWKCESGVGRFSPLGVHAYSDLLQAAEKWLTGMWGDDIDDVVIEWRC